MSFKDHAPHRSDQKPVSKTKTARKYPATRSNSGYVLRASRFFRAQPLACFGALLLGLFIVLACLAPVIAPRDPAELDLAHRMAGSSTHHLFGTDALGRDVFSRIIYGARISLVVAVCVVTLSLSIGILAGSLAGFYEGVTDVILNVYVSNAFLALPGILLAIAVVAFLGPGLRNLVFALALSGWVGYARLVRLRSYRCGAVSLWKRREHWVLRIFASCSGTFFPTSCSR